jgi:cell division septum initiation protein DivIVA
MVKDFFESIKVDVRDKSRNPFIGAFILVWTIKNWEAIYTFFTFDKDVTREDKIETLKGYFKDYSIWDFFTTVLVALLVIILSYILLNITRGIVNLFEKRVTPKILQITGYDDVVPISDHQKIIDRNSKLEKQVKELKSEIAELKIENEELEKSMVIANSSKEKVLKFGKTLQNSLNEKINPEDEKRTVALAKKIVDRMTENTLSIFIKIYETVQNNEPIYQDIDMGPFELNDLFKLQQSTRAGYTFYKTTDLGEKTYEFAKERSKKESEEF